MRFERGPLQIDKSKETTGEVKISIKRSHLPLDRREVFLFPVFHVSWSAEDHGRIIVETLLGVLRMHRKRALKFESRMNETSEMNKRAEFFADSRQRK